MKRLLIAAFAAVVSLGLMVPEAEAKRLGGGKSFGMQRQATPAPTQPAAAGKPAVAPSAETVKNGSYQPLARPVFIYVSAKSLDKPEVKEFVDFYLNQAPQLVPAVKYLPLPEKAYQLAREHVAKKKLGTAFGGEPDVGLTVEELLQREGKL